MKNISKFSSKHRSNLVYLYFFLNKLSLYYLKVINFVEISELTQSQGKYLQTMSNITSACLQLNINKHYIRRP